MELEVPFESIVRNLSTVNFLPSNPSRCCVKKGKPAPLIIKMIANKGIIQERTSTIPIMVNIISKSLLIALFNPLDSGSFRSENKGKPSSDSINSFPL